MCQAWVQWIVVDKCKESTVLEVAPAAAQPVAAIDDHEVALVGLAHLLGTDGTYALTHTAATVPELLKHDLTGVQAVLLDLRLHDSSDPFDNVLALAATGIPLLIFSSLESPFLVRRALQAGARGMVAKTANADEIVTAITYVASGDTYATAEWAAAIDSDPLLDAVHLSQRQQQVLELYAMGEPAKRVANALGITVETVQDYVNRIRTKYALAGRPVGSKVDLLLRAQEDGYVPSPTDPPFVSSAGESCAAGH